MASAETDAARIFGMGEPELRDSIVPSKRDTFANGMNGTLVSNKSPTNNDLNENDFIMPSYYEVDTTDNEYRIQTSFV
jgi:D-lyxose ketol-isomerase